MLDALVLIHRSYIVAHISAKYANDIMIINYMFFRATRGKTYS